MNYFFRSVIDWVVIMALAIIGAAILNVVGAFIGFGLGIYLMKKYWKNREEEQERKRQYAEWEKKEIQKREREQYRKEKTRKEALDLANNYPEATKFYFEKYWGIKKSSIDFTDITDNVAEKLVALRWSYPNEEMRLNPVYKKRIEEENAARAVAERQAAEKRRREEEVIRQRKESDIRSLPDCVASWDAHSNSSLKHKFYRNYYPYDLFKSSATSSMWETWHLVWNFKNDPNKNITESQHRIAMNEVVGFVENTLRSSFGTKTEYLTLVCLTASTQRKTELRYKDFAEKVCSDLKMTNAYPYVQVTEDGSAKHDGGTGVVERTYNTAFFRDKRVVLFDDIRTSGKSLERERQILEGFGAKVICAITIAQTTH